ncbi:MAG TPA: long-chain fatty acid--CoA ligase [Deltaproteobacteria bacterium]|nr:long-chain fatty acid--CoA ligase [Deltaproteobacteria bacterium]
MTDKMTEENILRMFQDTAERRGEEACLRYKRGGLWRSLSWTETLNEVQILSEALKKIGVRSGDRVALLSNTRYEWTLLDLAILSLGAVTVPIYHSSLPEEAKHILADSGSRMICVENSTQLEKILKIRGNLSDLEKIILIEGKVMGDGILTMEEFKALGEGEVSDFGSRIRQIGLDRTATLVYTSGTTGPPKGVMLTHANIAYEVIADEKTFPVDPGDISLMFLPLAHILARVIQFYQLRIGFTHAYAESIDKLLEDIGEIKPHFMVSVPRIFEKIYTKVMNDVESGSSFKKNIFYWALEVGKEHSAYVLKGQAIPTGLKIRYALATKLVFSKLHKKLGGRIRFFVSGGAPLAKEIAEFFHAAGILILEGYGLTETTAAINLNLPNMMKFGSVGKPLPFVEEKIAPDGEILVRGKMVFQGYWNKPEATREAIDSEGWFHTGDIGEFDERGILRITDRKKDIIVTAGGKNIAPQNIENLLKTNPIFSQIVVHGDRRKYLTALVTLNPDEVKSRANGLGMTYKNYSDLVASPEVHEMVKKVIDEKNQNLAKYESIKRFAVLDKDFSIESGELTPTLKVKRKVINERYKDIFDGLYSE